MSTYITETVHGCRRWEADSFDHAREQHVDAFPVDNSSEVRARAVELGHVDRLDVLFPERIRHVWLVLPDGEYEAEGCNLYTRRDGVRVGRPFTPAERVESERSVAAYTRFMDAAGEAWKGLTGALNELLPEGSTATVWQTGGMCLAIGFYLPEHGPEAHVMVTDELGPVPPDRDYSDYPSDHPGRYVVGVYLDNEDDGSADTCYAELNDAPLAGELERDAEAAAAILAAAAAQFPIHRAAERGSA